MTKSELESAQFRKRILASLLSDRARDLLAMVRRVGRYIVPVSVALAATGFCISVFHYHSRGVPLSALTNVQFVSTGCLYAALTLSAYGTAMHLAGMRLGTASLRFLAGLTITGMMYVIIPPRAVLLGLCYWVGITVMWWAAEASAYRAVIRRLVGKGAAAPTTSSTSATHGPSGWRVLFEQWVISTVVFATLVFPYIPPWVGGGAPRPISIAWSSGPEGDEVQLFGTATARRCLYEVYSDPSYLYLMSFEPSQQANCDAPEWLWRLTRRGVVRTPRAYFVISRSRIRTIAY